MELLGLISAPSSSKYELADGHLNNYNKGESPEFLTVARDTHCHRLFSLGNGRCHHIERTHTVST